MSSPVLDAVFIAITNSGGGSVLIGLTLLIYWLWDKKVGLLLTLTVLVSGAANGILKEVFQTTRPPFHLRLVPAEGYGFPSGHAQQTATFWSGAALAYRGVWTVLAPVLVALVAISRVYLGVHYVGSVIGGIALGGLFAAGGYLLYRSGLWTKLGFRTKLLVAALWPAALAPFYPLGSDVLRIIGVLAGFSVGYLLEGRWVRMGPSRGIGTAAFRAVVGISPLGAFYWVSLSMTDPTSLLLLHLALGLLASFLLPWFFTRVESQLFGQKQKS